MIRPVAVAGTDVAVLASRSVSHCRASLFVSAISEIATHVTRARLCWTVRALCNIEVAFELLVSATHFSRFVVLVGIDLVSVRLGCLDGVSDLSLLLDEVLRFPLCSKTGFFDGLAGF